MSLIFCIGSLIQYSPYVNESQDKEKLNEYAVYNSKNSENLILKL